MQFKCALIHCRRHFYPMFVILQFNDDGVSILSYFIGFCNGNAVESTNGFSVSEKRTLQFKILHIEYWERKVSPYTTAPSPSIRDPGWLSVSELRKANKNNKKKKKINKFYKNPIVAPSNRPNNINNNDKCLFNGTRVLALVPFSFVWFYLMFS